MSLSLDVSALVLIVAFHLTAGVWPITRQWRRTGVFPVTFARTANPLERGIGLVMGGMMLGAVGYGLIVAIDSSRMLVLAAPTSVRIAGLGLGVGALALTVYSQAAMGASWRIGIEDGGTALVTEGIFGVVRNPIYTAVCALVASLVLLDPGPVSAFAWVAVCALVAVQARLEEHHLIATHGEAYREYSARVGRFLPWLGRLG